MCADLFIAFRFLGNFCLFVFLIKFSEIISNKFNSKFTMNNEYQENLIDEQDLIPKIPELSVVQIFGFDGKVFNFQRILNCS